MAVRDCICRAGFDAIAAENAARIGDIVNLSVSLSCGDAIRVGAFRLFDVDAIRRASRRAEEAANALFESVFVAVQDVDSAIARLEMYRLMRIILRDGLPEHVPEGHAETFRQRAERLAY